MIQIFGTKKDKGTQKTLRFFKERRREIQFRDMNIKPPSPGELDAMAVVLGGHEALADREGAAAREKGLAYLDCDIREALLADPRLYRMPLIRVVDAGKTVKAAAGFDEKILIQI